MATRTTIIERATIRFAQPAEEYSATAVAIHEDLGGLSDWTGSLQSRPYSGIEMRIGDAADLITPDGQAPIVLTHCTADTGEVRFSGAGSPLPIVLSE